MVLNFRSLAGLSLLFAIAACNMPFEQFPPPSDVQTAAALTLQAMLTPSVTLLPPSTPSTSTTTTTPSPRVTQTSSTDSLTGTITTTFSVPMLTVLESTNCRTGPGEEYEVILTYLTGKELEIVGRYEPTNFWLVKSNESPAGTCWLFGGFVELTGSYLAVPSVTAPPTTTPRPPRTPGIVSWEFFCSDGNLNFTAF